MDLLGISLGCENVRRARVEDAGAIPELHVDVVERESVNVAFPEADLRDVGDGDEGGGIVLGGVHAAEGDGPIVFAISHAGDLVRCDRSLKPTFFSQSFDRGEDPLIRQLLHPESEVCPNVMRDGVAHGKSEAK